MGVPPRLLAACLGLCALVPTACSGSGDDSPVSTDGPGASPRSTTSVPSGQEASIVDALANGQAVQDFVIHLDFAVHRADGMESFYDAVLARAAEGAGTPRPLDGGHFLQEVSSLAGRIVDPTGVHVPSLSVDFALLGGERQALETGYALAADDVGVDVDPSAVADFGDPRLLVEVMTADIHASATHVAPGDRSAVDLTFVSSITPGDRVRSMYVFGQTLPGDPDVEADLPPLELFAYRWNEGLLRILGSDGDLDVLVDDTLEAVEGSTILRRDVKKGLLAIAGFEGYAHGAKRAMAELVQATMGASPATLLEFQKNDTGPADSFTHRFILYSAAKGALIACSDLATSLNENNERAWMLANPSRPTSADDAPASTATSGSTTTTPPKPEPVSCTPPERPRRPSRGPGDGPLGGTFGDVHLRTFDGLAYDNQAAGEFVLFDNGVATVQLRTEPFPGSDSVSVATAAAARLGGLAVSMHLSGTTFIDGEQADLVRGATVAVGDGALTSSPTGWVLVWPDGTVLRVHRSGEHLMVYVSPSASSGSTGLLGDNDQDPLDDFSARDGTLLAPNADDDFASFYADFVDSWRISVDESLFHYGPDETTATFTVTGFPARPTGVDLLGDEVRAAAEQTCRDAGVTAPDVIDACVLDVGLTGDRSFVVPAFAAQTALPELPDPAAADIDTSPPTGPAQEGGSSLTVGDIDIGFGADPPVQDPAGYTPRWGCNATGTTFGATSSFVEAPGRQFDIDIQYVAGRGGEDDRFAMVVQLNRVPYVWMLTWVEPRPGSIDEIGLEGAVLTASGTAFVNRDLDPNLMPFSALPSTTPFEPFSLAVACER